MAEVILIIDYDEERINLEEVINSLRSQEGVERVTELSSRKLGGSRMKVICHICDWQGTELDLVGKYVPNPTVPGGVVKEVVCPECGNQLGLDYLEEQPIA